MQPGYATAKIDVRGAVIRDGKILLVQEHSDQRWCMLSGWADVGGASLGGGETGGVGGERVQGRPPKGYRGF